MPTDFRVGRIPEAGFGEEARGGGGPDIHGNLVFAQRGDEEGFGGAGDGVVVELVVRRTDEVVGRAEGDDEVDFVGLVVGEAEVGEFAGAVVLVDSFEGGEEGGGAVGPVEGRGCGQRGR